MITTGRGRIAAIALAASSLPAAMLVPVATATAAPPASLSFTPTGDAGPDITLGELRGEAVCTGKPGDLTCVAPIGTHVSYALTEGVVEGDTGRAGTMDIACTVMYAGTQTTFSTRSGLVNATGSEDCDLHLDFGSGDEVWGAMHQQRTLVNNFETSTFSFRFTRGTGKYAGFSGQWELPGSGMWDPPGPISGDPTTAAPAPRIASALATLAAPREDESFAITVDRSKKPLVDVTSMGLLAPDNDASKVAVTAAAGATCKGTLTAGQRVIALPAKKISARGGAVVLKSLPAGALKGAKVWKLRVSCGPKSVPFVSTINTFEVLPDKPA